jgi:hypothetical protein
MQAFFSPSTPPHFAGVGPETAPLTAEAPGSTLGCRNYRPHAAGGESMLFAIIVRARLGSIVPF